MVKHNAASGSDIGKEFYGYSDYPNFRCIINIH